MIERERYGWYRGHGLDYDEGTWQWLEQAAGPDTPIDGTVEDGELLDLGGITVEVVALPGHSAGHLGVVHHESRTAIVMDAVLERGLYTTADELISPPPYGSVASYRGTIERLRSLQPARLGTSHYAPVEGDAAVAAFLDATAGFVDDLDAAVDRRAGRGAAAARALLARRGRRRRPVQRDGGRARPVGRRPPRRRGGTGARGGLDRCGRPSALGLRLNGGAIERNRRAVHLHI